MRRITEIQKFSGHKLIFALVLLLLGLPLVSTMSGILNSDILLARDWPGVLLEVLVLGGCLILMLTMKSYLRLEEEALFIRTNPFSSRQKKLSYQDLTDLYITGHKWFHGLGYKFGFTGARIFVLKPGKVLIIKTQKGKEYRVGLNRPQRVQKFLNEHWSEKRPNYG